MHVSPGITRNSLYLLCLLILPTLTSAIIAVPIGNETASTPSTASNIRSLISIGGKILPFKDVFRAGPYQIAQCRQGTGERALRGERISYILEYLRLRIRDAVIPDLQEAGVSSKHGFTTFFKSNSPRTILPIFQHMVEGTVGFNSPASLRFPVRTALVLYADIAAPPVRPRFKP